MPWFVVMTLGKEEGTVYCLPLERNFGKKSQRGLYSCNPVELGYNPAAVFGTIHIGWLCSHARRKSRGIMETLPRSQKTTEAQQLCSRVGFLSMKLWRLIPSCNWDPGHWKFRNVQAVQVRGHMCCSQHNWRGEYQNLLEHRYFIMSGIWSCRVWWLSWWG